MHVIYTKSSYFDIKLWASVKTLLERGNNINESEILITLQSMNTSLSLDQF